MDSKPRKMKVSSFMRGSRTLINCPNGFLVEAFWSWMITVLYLCQDMFPPGKYAKSISRNAHYIVAFKSPRDQLAMRNLLLQAFPLRWQDVIATFQRLTERPFGYMTIDLHPSSPDERRLISHLLKEEGCIRYHQFKRDTTS